MTTSDLIIHAGTIVTVDPHNRILSDHSLVMRDGRILDILPSQDARIQYSAVNSLERYQHILMPGLVNTHCHLAMNLLRGIADDLPLMTWLQEHIWPIEGKWVGPAFVKTGTELALAESLLGGVTCVNDMYFFPDQVATVADSIGIRAVVGMIVLDIATAWAKDADECIGKGLDLHDKLKNTPLMSTAFAPHAPYTVSREPLLRIATLSAELDVPIHMHVHETAAEVAQFEAQFGQRPIATLAELGLLSPSLLAVHMTQLTPMEIDLIAESGSQVLHCPESNLKLASGACPVDALLSRGVNVSLGTDGAASNNDLDMFGEMRSAALLAKHQSSNAATLPATTAIRMATINGATALGLQGETGSLEVGKAADCICVNCDEPGMVPMYNASSHLVYCNDRSNVTDVWVNGNCLVAERQLQTIDREALMADVHNWTQKINHG